MINSLLHLWCCHQSKQQYIWLDRVVPQKQIYQFYYVDHYQKEPVETAEYIP